MIQCDDYIAKQHSSDNQPNYETFWIVPVLGTKAFLLILLYTKHTRHLQDFNIIMFDDVIAIGLKL